MTAPGYRRSNPYVDLTEVMRRSKAKFRRQKSITSPFSKAKRCPVGIERSIEDCSHGFHAEGDAAADEVSTATLDCDRSSCQASSATSTFGDVGDSFNVDFCSWLVHSSGLSSEAKLRLLNNHFVPDKGYNFSVRVYPDKRGCRRRFQIEWVEK